MISKLNLFAFTIFLYFIIGLNPTSAQLLPETEKAEEVVPEIPDDSLGRRTPRGTVSGFIQAMGDRKYTRASQYFDLKKSRRSETERERLVLVLQRLLDQGGNIMPYSWLSNQGSGKTDDELPPGVDLVGTVTADGEPINLFVENKQDANNAPLWLFSSTTIDAIANANVADALLLDRFLPDFLQRSLIAGVPLGHWLAMILLAVFAYYISKLFFIFLIFVIRSVWKKAAVDPPAGIITALALPFQLYLAVWLFVITSQEIGISIIVRQRLSGITLIIGMIALLILLWRLADFISTFTQKRMNRRGRVTAVSVILFLRRAAKVAIVIFGVLAILSTLGFDVTTGLAALGIGGIALALGAQKTVENFVGSVTLIADQPIRVGDFCTVAGVTGTVEQIGMRSTRIRTLGRTIVSIPNGEFSSSKIENFAHRDRFLLQTVLDLRYETTPDQIRFLLVELRQILYAHPMVNPEPARVRFISLATSSLQLEVYAYIDAPNFDVFLEVQEDLLLRMMDTVAASGTEFAFPSQTLYMAREKGLSEEKIREAEDRVRAWREKNDIQIPNFEKQRIEELKGSITYPAEGSVGHKIKKL